MTLIGATTENPYFEVNSALLSRCQVVELEALSEEELAEVVRRGAAAIGRDVPDEIVALIARRAGGDARTALTRSSSRGRRPRPRASTLEDRHVDDAARKRPLRYDKGADQHYDFTPPSSSRCAAPIPTPRSTTSPRCSRAARTPLHRAAHGDLRLRGRRQRRSARAPGRRRGRARARARRPARGAAQPPRRRSTSRTRPSRRRARTRSGRRARTCAPAEPAAAGDAPRRALPRREEARPRRGLHLPARRSARASTSTTCPRS